MTAWLAVDWGTSRLRVWAMARDGRVLSRHHTHLDVTSLSRDGFEPALLALLGDTLGSQSLPVVICGMAGARDGWAEAPYQPVPCSPPGIAQARHLQTADARLLVYLLPGVSQASPTDVMRGEETQIAGFLALNPKFDGVVCLPGTHTKWVHISAGEIVSFRSFMTGELFALLSQNSVLAPIVTGAGWDEACFADAVSTALARPSDLAARLFSIRAEGVLSDLAPAQARARLSGLLIGTELAAAKPYWLGQHVALIGDDRLCAQYAGALSAQGLPVERTDAERMTLEGLKAAYAALQGRAA